LIEKGWLPAKNPLSSRAIADFRDAGERLAAAQARHHLRLGISPPTRRRQSKQPGWRAGESDVGTGTEGEVNAKGRRAAAASIRYRRRRATTVANTAVSSIRVNTMAAWTVAPVINNEGLPPSAADKDNGTFDNSIVPSDCAEVARPGWQARVQSAYQ
jgi:hypothetical protein